LLAYFVVFLFSHASLPFFFLENIKKGGGGCNEEREREKEKEASEIQKKMER
jgi:hypothetical protein